MTLTGESPGYNIKQYNVVAPVMLEPRGMPSNPSLPSLPGTLRSGVVAPDRVLSMAEIQLFNI